MSRSNGPIGPSVGAQPAQWRFPTEAEAAAAARPGQQVPPYQPQSYPTQGFPQTPHSSPQAYAPGGGRQDAGYFAVGQPVATQQPNYKPVFDRFAPPNEPAPGGYDPRLAPQFQPQPPQQPVYSSPGPASDALQALRGSAFDQWQQSVQAGQQPAPTQAYDFGHYASPPQQPAYGAPRPVDYSQQPPPHEFAQPQSATYQPPMPRAPVQGAPFDEQHWRGGQDPAALVYAAPGHGYAQQPALQGYDANGYEQPAAVQGGQLQPVADQGYDADDQSEYEDEDDEAPRGRRGLIIVAALVGAIGIGGGMAYAYKTFIKPSTGTSAVAKILAPKGPSKTQPADPGGKQFANQDSKLQSRLGDGSAPAIVPAAPVAAIDSESGVKRVTTQVIARDGSIVPPQIQASTPVPGMTIVDGINGPRPLPPALPQATVAAVNAVAPPVQPSIQPRPLLQARVPVANAPAAEGPIVAAAPPIAKKLPTPKKPVARDDLAAAGGGAAATAVVASAAPAAAKTGGNGFVAVLASKSSRADASKTNTDLEQKFDVLKGKIFDVQEADLTAQGKGVVFRSVVGPPGSREFASGVCSQLKTVGYTSCWITAY